MSGRRLLDAAKLFNASRSVAKQHWALRSQQLDAYNKTSSLARAVKEQTDRVTLTAQAAITLAQRLNEQAPTYEYSTSYPPPASQARNNGPIPREESVLGSTDANGKAREGLDQDHHYEASDNNSTGDLPPTSELSVKQEIAEQHPLPDGTVPSANATYEQGSLQNHAFMQRELSANGARQSQRQSEAQIPAVTSTDSNSRAPAAGLAAGHDQDVFYERPTTPNLDYSSLPRAKIPKHTTEQQEGGENLDQEGINADTFYSAGSARKGEDMAPAEGEVPEGVDLNVFRTSKGSKMLGSNTKKKEPPKADEEFHQLAAELARDAGSGVRNLQRLDVLCVLRS
jgi:aarF domain-containing kinase